MNTKMNIRTAATAILLSLATLAPTQAGAETRRLDNLAYLAASHCLAYADLPQLQGDVFDAAALREAVAQPRLSTTRDHARSDAADIRAVARNAHGDAAVARLRRQRDDACASFAHN